MENREEGGFEWFMVNNNPSPSPPSILNHKPFVTGNLPMPENHLPPNGGVGSGFHRLPSSFGDYQYPNMAVNPNPSFPDTLYDPLLETEFSNLNLSTTTLPVHHHQSPFLAPSAAINGGGSVLGNNLLIDRSLFDMGGFPGQMSNMNLDRLRIQSAVRGQMGLYMQQQPGSEGNLDGFAFPLNAFTDFDNLYNAGRNLNVNQTVARPPRNSFQFQSPYEFGSGVPNNYSSNGNGFRLDKPIQTRGGRSTNNGHSSSLMSSLYTMTGNGSVYQSRPRPKFPASLEDMKGKVLLLATDQHGCHFLQKKFEERKPEDIDLIFSEVKDHIRQLMVHQFGNYLIQKFFEVCGQANITQILASVISHEQALVKICHDIHGTRAMQKLLEHLTTKEQRTSVVSVLERVTVTVPLTKSANGHHVIQHCLKFFPCEEIEKILHVVADYCVPIATDQSGCCVLQQCVARAAREPKERLVAEITANAIHLSQDPYGNYVVQFVLDMGVPRYTADILAALAGSFVSLSMDKYGSNVVEKCINSSEDQSAEVIKEIVYSPNFLMVIQNAYGNYVAQSALTCSKGALREAVTSLIQRHYPFLHSHPHGKRALARARGSKHTVYKRV